MENPRIRLIVNPKYEGNTALMGFLRTLPDTFAGGGTVLWNKRNQIRRFVITNGNEKAGNEADTGETSADGGGSITLVVKKYKHPNVFLKIGALFSQTKAEKAYRNGLELIRRGFLTPEPVACVEIKGAVFIKEDYLVTLNTGWHPIADALERPDWNKSLATDFGRFAARLHQHGILHNDLNKTNVLYNVGADFQLIDNNRMRFLPQVSKPADKAQAPARKYQQPSQNGQAPSQKYQQPSQNGQAPSQKYQMPSQNGQAPSQKYQQPSQNAQAPPQKYQMPSDRACMENLTRFTGNLALFSFVAEAYARARGLDADLWLPRALRQKRRHDRRWHLKKALAHPIRTLKRLRNNQS